jgi:hypothetical protein
MYLPFAGRHAVEQRHGNAVEDECAAHVPRLIALPPMGVTFGSE